MIETHWLHPSDERWRSYLQRLEHDIYHLPEYAEVSAQQTGADARAFVAYEGDALLFVPLLLRSLPQALNAPTNWRDATTPYGYPCPLFSSDSADTTRRLVDAFIGAAREQGVVSVFCRLHPLLHSPTDALARVGQLRHHGQTVYIDTETSRDDLWTQLRSNHRRDLKKLGKQGFYTSHNDWEHYEDFIAIYYATMERLDADEGYFFDRRYFTSLKARLGSRLHLWCVHNEADEVVAAGLFTSAEQIIEYHLGGTKPDYLRQAPSKLLFHQVSLWAHTEKIRFVHLGGGLGGREDSLFHFKKGFSDHLADFATFGAVIDDLRYHRLVEAWQDYSGARAEVSFFPAYRKGL